MSVPQLRVVTYLCPSVPVELFQNVLELLEECTGHRTTLQYEWRSDGPADDRPDPFTSNLADLAFIPSSGYIRLESKKNDFAELLPVTPLFKHLKGDPEKPGTYIDIVVHSDKLQHNVSEISDLRGCRWACSGKSSLVNYVTINMLKEIGENMSFFGMAQKTDSHLEAVNMVLNKKVEAAAIDSTALVCNKNMLHNGGKDIVVLTSFGPYSPYAIVINSRLNPDLKKKILNAFQKMSGDDTRFNRYGLVRFVENHKDLYLVEKQFVSNVGTKFGDVPYY